MGYRTDFTVTDLPPLLPHRPRGVLDPRLVRLSSFAISSAGLLLATVVTLLAIWKQAQQDTAWRAIATLGVLVAAALLFNVVNEFFGARLADLLPPQAPTLPPPGPLPREPDPSPASLQA